MELDSNIEIFEGKSFSALSRDIYNNQVHKKNQIDVLIDDLRKLIKGINDVTIVAPVIKDYLDVGVKNDEVLVKLSAVLQRWITATVPRDEDGNALGLSESEKDALLAEVKDNISELKDYELEVTQEKEKIDGKHNHGLQEDIQEG